MSIFLCLFSLVNESEGFQFFQDPDGLFDRVLPKGRALQYFYYFYKIGLFA